MQREGKKKVAIWIKKNQNGIVHNFFLNCEKQPNEKGLLWKKNVLNEKKGCHFYHRKWRLIDRHRKKEWMEKETYQK